MIFNNYKQEAFEDFSLGLSINSMNEQKENVLHMSLVSDDKPLFIQTPRISYHTDEKNIILYFKGKTLSKINLFYKFIRSLENRISQLVQDALVKLSPDIITSDLFKSSIVYPENVDESMSLSVSIDKESCNVYNRKGEQINSDLDHTKETHYCTFILVCDYIRVTPTSAKIHWKAVQALLHPKKTKKNKINHFEILTDPDEQKKEKPIQFKQFGVIAESRDDDDNNNNKNKTEEEGIEIKLN